MANLWFDEYTPILKELLATRTRYRKIADAINEKFGTGFDAHFVCKVVSRLKLAKAPSEVNWTDEAKVRLTELYYQPMPLSFGAMARRLNAEFGTHYSICAVVGQSKRLKLSGKQIVPSPTRTSPNPRVRLVSVNGNPNGNLKHIIPIKDAPIALRCVEIVPRHLTLMQLEPTDCRYPYGDGPITFCGHVKKDGSSYCRLHYELCIGQGTTSERRATEMRVA